MSYLVDTNVISELVKLEPSKKVSKWFDEIPDESLYISVLTLGEIRKGVEKVTDRHKREKLRIWLEHELPAWFGDRILNVNKQVVDRWGKLLAQVKTSLPAIDSLIGATALSYDLSLVTRNINDFELMGIELINPWN